MPNINNWINCDVVIQAGHQNTPDGTTGGESQYGKEIEWTPVVADEAVRILKGAGVDAIKIDASIKSQSTGYRCKLATFVHFDDPDSGETGPSVGYPVGMGNEGAAQQWKTLYKSFWPFPETWHADNYTNDLRGYYGYRYTQTTDAEFLIEFGDLQSERQALWMKPRLKWLGALLAHYLSKRTGLGNVPVPRTANLPAKPQAVKKRSPKVVRKPAKEAKKVGAQKPFKTRAGRGNKRATRNLAGRGPSRESLDIIVDLVPRENSNRPGTPLHPTKITIHNTDNDNPGADASAHCRYMKGEDARRRRVSWHFTVDDHSIYQSLPVDEVGWHAGTHEGNAESIGIEICQNRGIDHDAANDRAARLTSVMLHELGIRLNGNVVQHHDWSGKDCPMLLRHAADGWTHFLEKVASYYGAVALAPPAENDHAAPVHLKVHAAAPEILHRSLDQILEIAENSDIARYHWLDRGRAPMGYIKGMALVFARVYCKLKNGDAAATEMAKAATGTSAGDTLVHYAQQFAALNMNNSRAGADTLRHLFALMLGLGMRESSGKHCEGRDQSASNVTAETAEAGLFQTSYNARACSPQLLTAIFQQYQAAPSGFIDIFKEGVRCRPADAENYGSGLGREFQRLSKECPAFAAEFTAVALRNTSSHWGPIIAHKAEIRSASDEMLKQVQTAVDASRLCPALFS